MDLYFRTANEFTLEETRALLQSWNLSPKMIAVLEKEPEIVEALAEARSLPPFPSG